MLQEWSIRICAILLVALAILISGIPQIVLEPRYIVALESYVETYVSVHEAEMELEDRRALWEKTSCIVIPKDLPTLYVRWQEDLRSLKDRLRVVHTLEMARLRFANDARLDHYARMYVHIAENQRYVSALVDLEQRLLRGAIFCPEGEPV